MINMTYASEDEQTGTRKMANGKPQINIAVPSYAGIESMVAARFACATERLVCKEISTLMADSSHRFYSMHMRR